MTTAAHVKYSNCIRYNFFLFCPICMKFSHNILHTYSFILSIIKHNWKIRRFWVVDPLKEETYRRKRVFFLFNNSLFEQFFSLYSVVRAFRRSSQIHHQNWRYFEVWNIAHGCVNINPLAIQEQHHATSILANTRRTCSSFEYIWS